MLNTNENKTICLNIYFSCVNSKDPTFENDKVLLRSTGKCLPSPFIENGYLKKYPKHI